MAKNYMKEVAALLGVELGEWFQIKTNDVYDPKAKYVLRDNGLFCELDRDFMEEPTVDWWDMLLTGEAEIVKLPWRPKCGERYCSWSVDIHMSKECLPYMSLIWKNSGSDIERLAMGNCFKSYKDAIEHKEEVIKLYTDVLKRKE